MEALLSKIKLRYVSILIAFLMGFVVIFFLQPLAIHLIRQNNVVYYIQHKLVYQWIASYVHDSGSPPDVNLAKDKFTQFKNEQIIGGDLFDYFPEAWDTGQILLRSENSGTMFVTFGDGKWAVFYYVSDHPDGTPRNRGSHPSVALDFMYFISVWAWIGYTIFGIFVLIVMRPKKLFQKAM